MAEAFYRFVLWNLGEHLHGHYRSQAMEKVSQIESHARLVLYETEKARRSSKLSHLTPPAFSHPEADLAEILPEVARQSALNW
ncbi:MAG: hypothetical protein ACREJN_11670 [Nitrospiraceae bacterium]